MKTLIFIRHGKSSWEYNVSDRERPLKNRGIRDGALIGKELRGKGYTIDKVYSSPAVRALHTAEIICKNISIPLKNIIIEETLYDFSGNNVLAHIHQLNAKINTVLYVGHNYAVTNIVSKLGSKYFDNVPTTGLVILRFEVEKWHKIITGETVLHVFPKEIRDARK